MHTPGKKVKRAGAKNKMWKVKPGVVIMMLGLSGMVFALASSSMSMIEKIPLTIICFFVMMLGAVIENPRIEELINPSVEEEPFS